MPFNPPFREYVSGDWFFGLSGGRARLLKQLTKGKYTTEDIGLKPGQLHNPFIDYLLTPPAKDTVGTLNQDFAEYLRADPQRKEVVTDMDLQKQGSGDWSDPAQNLIWKRKSKAALEFLVTRHHFVHFAIDVELQKKMADVINPELNNPKKFGTNPTEFYEWKTDQEKWRIITFSELRFAYRHRNNEAFQKRLQFWYEKPGNPGNLIFVPERPPWEHTPEWEREEKDYVAIWKSYKPVVLEE